jgi:hypothetical protein
VNRANAILLTVALPSMSACLDTVPLSDLPADATFEVIFHSVASEGEPEGGPACEGLLCWGFDARLSSRDCVAGSDPRLRLDGEDAGRLWDATGWQWSGFELACRDLQVGWWPPDPERDPPEVQPTHEVTIVDGDVELSLVVDQDNSVVSCDFPQCVLYDRYEDFWDQRGYTF